MLPAQLGGAAGTLSVLHPHGVAVQQAFAHELDLAVPDGVWHTDRTVVTDLAGALGTAAAAIGKTAGDLVLLAQTEVGEVSERSPGGSSAMPHKRNPVAAVTARAAAAQVPGLVATLLAQTPELQRGAGPWHAEWPALLSLLRFSGGAAARLRVALDLDVHPDAMARNLRGAHRRRRPRPHRRPGRRIPLPQEHAMMLHARIDGRDELPTLVLVGSVGSTTDMWTPVLAPLAEQFRVVRIDHRGHGGSQPAQRRATRCTLADLGTDVLETLDGLGVEQAHFAGLSLGAMTGMWLAIHHPERIARLALLCTSRAHRRVLPRPGSNRS